MDWWCSSSLAPWSWSPTPYVGALVIVAGLAAVGVWWSVSGRRTDPIETARAESIATEVRGTSRGRTISFVLGLIGFWVVLDWPLASLGAGYLASAQMIRQVLMIMVVSPLLLFAVPPALGVRIFGWGRGLRLLQLTARPIFSVPFVAGMLLLINVPTVVDTLLPTQYGAFVMDVGWVLAGLVLWMPVQCPHPGVRRLEGPVALMYLIGQSIVPVLPGFFTTWADHPVYATYELAPRVIDGLDPITDQQAAAGILQVGSMFLLWVQIGYRFLAWGSREMESNRVAAKAMRGPGPSAA